MLYRQYHVLSQHEAIPHEFYRMASSYRPHMQMVHFVFLFLVRLYQPKTYLVLYIVCKSFFYFLKVVNTPFAEALLSAPKISPLAIKSRNAAPVSSPIPFRYTGSLPLLVTCAYATLPSVSAEKTITVFVSPAKILIGGSVCSNCCCIPDGTIILLSII